MAAIIEIVDTSSDEYHFNLNPSLVGPQSGEPEPQVELGPEKRPTMLDAPPVDREQYWARIQGIHI